MKRIAFLSAVLYVALCMSGIARGNAPTSQPITIHNSKELLKLPNKLHDKIVYVMPGKYDGSAKTFDWQHVLFTAADPNRPPSLRLPAAQEFRWLWNSVPTTMDVTIQNIHGDFPGARSGFLHVLGGDQIRLIDCSQNIGNVYWIERRTGRIYIRRHLPGKPADKYLGCDFVDTVDEIIVDERGCDAWWLQGLNEGCIRDMQSRHSIYLGIQGLGSGYKYWGQDRAGGLHEWIQCNISGGPHHANSCFTVGWMAASAGIKSNPLDCCRLLDSVLDGLTQENKTAKRIEIVRTKIGGVLTNRVISN